MRKTGLSRFFGDNVFSADQVDNGKPAPDLFLHAARVMGIAPEQALVIEDSTAGVRAGVSAGMTVAGFTGASHISAGHHEILRDHGTHHILSSMADLPSLLEELDATH